MHYIVPQDLAAALDEISISRLSSYRNFFAPQSDEELYGLYCWNDAISSRFMRLIGIVEILLRNRFHVALSRKYWDTNVSKGTLDSNDWFLQLYDPYKRDSSSMNEGEKKIAKKIGPKNNQAPSPKVIASMTYGFWPRVLDAQRTINGGAPVPWDELIPQIVPGHHQQDPTYWKKQKHQDSLYARMNFVGDLRNRVAHFEPIWKFGEEKSEVRQRNGKAPDVIARAPTTVDEALERLKSSYHKTTQLLHWLSKSRAFEYAKSENNQALMWLMSHDGLNHFRSKQNNCEVRLSSLVRRVNLKNNMRKNVCVIVTDKGKHVGKYYQNPC